MRIRNPFSLVVILAVAIGASSCKKYPDGGLVSKSEKRISSTIWKLDKYYRNGTDETSQLLISDFEEEFQENGTLHRTYTDPNGDLVDESGSWAFENDNQDIAVTGIGSVELTNQTSTVSSSRYTITRLKKKEFWYSYDNGGDTHEFRMIPK